MILIIDFGSQYNQLIARRVREHHVYCQIEPPEIDIARIKALHPEGIILSGGPASIYEKGSPRADRKIFDLGIPVLGICYGMQFMVDALGGRVIRAEKTGIRVRRTEDQICFRHFYRHKQGNAVMDEPWRHHRRTAERLQDYRINP